MPAFQANGHLALCAGHEASVLSVNLIGRADANLSGKISRIAVTVCRKCSIVGETLVCNECGNHVLNCMSHEESSVCAECLPRRQDTIVGVDCTRLQNSRQLLHGLCALSLMGRCRSPSPSGRKCHKMSAFFHKNGF